MKRYVILIIVTLCAFLSTESAVAQYYSWGTDPTSYRWKQMKSDKYRVVYPDTVQNIASRMMCYLDAVEQDIDYGYRYEQMSIPFVVHPANFRSNGLVMWLPKRVEFLSTPEKNGYSMPWLKQLIAHEYRHAAQYSNLNRGVIKGLSYILGQQGSAIGLLVMPLWLIEGDAVMTETEMSTFGRGLQPSFTMAYRAYGNVADVYKSTDKWFSGSYKDYIPDHYALGYLISRHSYNRFGTVMGNDVAMLTTRRPYMFVSTSWVLKKLYGTSKKQLFDDTFRTLHNHWLPLSRVHNSATPISIPEPTSYTTYAYPMPTPSGKIIALKSDFDKPSAFVEIDPTTGEERRIRHTGQVSTRPIISSTGRMWWTEYRRSVLFQEKVGSQLYYMDLADEQPCTIRGVDNALYPTPTSDHGIAWVEYNIDGRYTVVVNGTSSLPRTTTLPYGSEIHGMAWDDQSEALYILVTDDDGMHISRIDSQGVEAITRSAYTTLSDLRAADGRLYFGSIASGRDEIHYLDIATGKEYRVSTSRYGTFQPTPCDSGLLTTLYDRRGYLPALQRIDSLIEVEYAPHPTNIILPEIKPWDVVNLDTVRFDTTVADSIEQKTPAKRFRRFAHAFNIHSWAPASYDPFELAEESSISFNLGATIMSQNILSTTEGFLTWGWNHKEGSVFKGTIRYYGLGVSFWISGTYGGSQNVYKVYVYNPESGELEFPAAPELGKYYSITTGATLPLLFERGYHIRQLSLSASWNYSNGMVANVDRIKIQNGKVTNLSTIGYSEGVHLLNAGISFSDVVRQARRDFLPPWGYQLSANYAQNPATDDFGHLVVLYGKIYTPGFYRHHSLSAAVSYQTSLGGFQSDMVLSSLALKSTRLMPRGFSSYDITNDNYVASSLNYQMPVWYPDGGINGIIYFKRLRLNLGGDYASFARPTVNTDDGIITKRRTHIGSFGLDLGVDFTLFGMPDSATISATFSLYRRVWIDPKQTGKFHFGFGLGLPF